MVGENGQQQQEAGLPGSTAAGVPEQIRECLLTYFHSTVHNSTEMGES